METPSRPIVIAITGGPGAGKTALLEIIRKRFCEHVQVLPEAAGVIFSGGFPRRNFGNARAAAQRAIYHVQRELERSVDEDRARAVFCDRGTLDGLAYWPGYAESFFRDLNTSYEIEIARYSYVIHLRVPSAEERYNHVNPLRIETINEARAVDEKILEIWSRHPNRIVIPECTDFFDKIASTLRHIEGIFSCPCALVHPPNRSHSAVTL